jgi:CRISPR-associated protein Cmr5
MAQAAHQRIVDRRPNKDFAGFAREFPTLVHSCGLAQAIAFAMAKKKHHLDYVKDLALVLTDIGHEQVGTAEDLANRIRNENFSVTDYIRLSRDALAATQWLKRYVEAAVEPLSLSERKQ